MSDLISRQAAITAICEDGTWLESQGCTEITMCERKQRDADILSELPTIDAVPVVRCRDCKYYNHEKDEDRWDSESCNHPLFDVSDPYECYVLRVEPDDFCSRGERRTDERPD